MVEGMKSVSEQNAKMTEEMKELTMKNAAATEQMQIATQRMADLAELNRQQAVQSELQAKSMAILAYDAKRDSEVMKAITVVTLIFLPGTFIAVCPMPLLIDHLPTFSFADHLQYGFLQYWF